MKGSAGVPLVVYVLFAALVFWLHGAEPRLSIDHVYYFRLADQVRAAHPAGDYWRSADWIHMYGVVLAYLYQVTGSHVLSLKLVLALMTIPNLAAFHSFMRMAGARWEEAILFSLLSGMFVSFGASVWGVTDFAATVARILVLPLVVMAVWFFFSRGESLSRYAVFPALALASLVHLSALHAFGVLAAYEGLDFLFRRAARIDRRLGAFLVAIAVALAFLAAMSVVGIATSDVIRLNVEAAFDSAPTGSRRPARGQR
jgi:hypothetical protein